jgi:hypothetical protein
VRARANGITGSSLSAGESDGPRNAVWDPSKCGILALLVRFAVA